MLNRANLTYHIKCAKAADPKPSQVRARRQAQEEDHQVCQVDLAQICSGRRQQRLDVKGDQFGIFMIDRLLLM